MMIQKKEKIRAAVIPYKMNEGGSVASGIGGASQTLPASPCNIAWILRQALRVK
jgi:hypothetical protein